MCRGLYQQVPGLTAETKPVLFQPQSPTLRRFQDERHRHKAMERWGGNVCPLKRELLCEFSFKFQSPENLLSIILKHIPSGLRAQKETIIKPGLLLGPRNR